VSEEAGQAPSRMREPGPAEMSGDPGLRARIRAGERLSGCFAFMPCAQTVEVLALAGFDFVIIDLEHAPKSWDAVEQMIRAAQLHRLPALVRVPEISGHWILGSLELGAAGIVLPMLETVDQLRLAVDALRYPPLGRRGTCTQTRAARHGQVRSAFGRHAQQQNDELVLMALIETGAGLAAARQFMAPDFGLDLISVGRSDLASSLGHPGQAGHPDVVEATHRLLREAADHPARTCRSAMVIYDPSEAQIWLPDGCTVFIAPSESGLLMQAGARWAGAARGDQPL